MNFREKLAIEKLNRKLFLQGYEQGKEDKKIGNQNATKGIDSPYARGYQKGWNEIKK